MRLVDFTFCLRLNARSQRTKPQTKQANTRYEHMSTHAKLGLDLKNLNFKTDNNQQATQMKAHNPNESPHPALIHCKNEMQTIH